MENENYIFSWVVWEPNAFDHEDSLKSNDIGSDATGRFLPAWGRDGDKLVLDICSDVEEQDYYAIPKKNKSFYISLNQMGTINEKVKLYDSGYGKLVTNEGIVLADVEENLINKVDPVFTASEGKSLLSQIEKGQMFKEERKNSSTGDMTYYFYEPIEILNTGINWSYIIVVPVKEVMAKLVKLIIFLVGLTLVGVAFMAGMLYYNSTYAVKGITALSDILNKLASYDLTFDESHEAVKYLDKKDELGNMTRALGAMQKNFSELIKQTIEAVGQVSSSSQELTAIAQQASMTSEEVAQTIKSC